MANSYVQYTGDGTTQVFSVPFKYLDRSHVKVSVDGINKAFSWLSSNSIRLTAKPALDTVIDIRRTTPNTKPLVDFNDGSTITEADLDKLAYQQIFLSQEAKDLYNDINGTAEGLVEMVQDALASVAENEQLVTEAVDRSLNAELIVLNTGSQVNLDATAAAASKDTAVAAQLNAEEAANTAASNAGMAATKATEASASAAAAAASAAAAAAAANFNPEDFYTRTQVDGILTTTTFTQSQIVDLGTTLGGKANTIHNHLIADINGLQTALDTKLGTASTAASAAKLSTARTITLTGDATGSVAFDGTANVSLSVAVVDNSHLHSIANVSGLQTALDAKAAETIQVIAGNGMTGGGTLAANRTITMGTPGTLSGSTTNTVSATSHTHAINAANVVQLGTADLDAGQTGTYALMTRPSAANAVGGTTAGSNLRYCSAAGVDSSIVPSGTWRCMGYTASATGAGSVTLWMRIA